MKSILSFIVLESIFALLIGIMKGLGKLNMSVLWTIVSYYMLGLPLAFFFAFYARSVL
jgi:Na+-driven multidrug efflux pump